MLSLIKKFFKSITENTITEGNFTKNQEFKIKEIPKEEIVEIPVCPYCKKILEKKPQRKKKCPFCNNFIFVCKSPVNRREILVTEDENLKIKAEWEKINYKEKWINKMNESGFHVTEKDLILLKNEFFRKNGKEMSDEDAIWTLFNKIISKAKNISGLAGLYRSMALFLHEENRNFFPILQQSLKMNLLEYQESGILKKVEVLACDDGCEKCKKLNGRIFTIKNALEKMPIPCEKCTHKMDEEDEKAFCRCIYLPVVD